MNANLFVNTRIIFLLKPACFGQRINNKPAILKQYNQLPTNVSKIIFAIIVSKYNNNTDLTFAVKKVFCSVIEPSSTSRNKFGDMMPISFFFNLRLIGLYCMNYCTTYLFLTVLLVYSAN